MMNLFGRLLRFATRPREQESTRFEDLSFAPSSENRFDLATFNTKFVAANEALARGDTQALKDGIALLIEALPSAGHYAASVARGVRELRCALTQHDRADMKGPWNWDLSGYGVMSWKNDLYDRDVALRRAWEFLGPVNTDLVAEGLGFR